MIATDIHIEKTLPSSSQKIISFLDAELRQDYPFSMQKEFPALFTDFPGGESLIVTQGEEIIAHLGYVVREFQCADYRMKIGMIGSVVTNKAYRGQGIASRLLKKAFEDLRLKGCVVSILWSENAKFYFPLGFYRAGRERDLKFSVDSVPDVVVPSRKASVQDANQIWRLYQRNPYKIDRSLEEQKHLLQIPNCQVLVTGENAVTSYIAINKGADFENYIHEWGGNPQDVLQSITYAQRELYPDKELTLIAPMRVDLNPIKQFAKERWNGAVGLFKVLDRTMLLSLYENYLRKLDVQYSWNREKNGILFGKQEVFARNDQELIQMVFGEGEVAESHPELPFFLWGFDSI